jgi:hypothetical protein
VSDDVDFLITHVDEEAMEDKKDSLFQWCRGRENVRRKNMEWISVRVVCEDSMYGWGGREGRWVEERSRSREIVARTGGEVVTRYDDSQAI